ncbi:MAG TPA: hypothetical protein VMP01_15930 [Pirellulaceae bacterium]|nr:hypothetical protein [Pirellulaceae bacterium]
MRTLTTLLLGLAIVLGSGSTSWAIGHHKSPAKRALKDVKKARKAAAKQDRPKLLHHHKK